MITDAPVRIAVVFLLLSVIAVRLPQHAKTFRTDRIERFESKLNIVLRSAVGLVGFAALLAWLFAPRSMEWATLPLPRWTRWCGLLAGVGGVVGLAWVHRELGRNFSGTLQLNPEQTLVTSGPYRWIRHPMYSAFYLVALSFFLLSSNWVIGICWFGGLTAVMVSRIGREEAVLASRFGDDYRAWSSRTGRFLPRVHRPLQTIRSSAGDRG